MQHQPRRNRSWFKALPLSRGVSRAQHAISTPSRSWPQRVRRALGVGALCVVIAGVSACSSAPSSAVSESDVEDFPVSVSGANGAVTIAARPERIIVLSASLTETFFAVGAGDQVIAVDSYSNYPPEAPTTELSAFRPNIEAIAAYEPDLVVLSRDTDGIVATLASVEIDALVLPSATNLDEVYTQIETVGLVTGHRDTATDLAAEMRREIGSQLARLDGVTIPTTFFYEMSDDYKTLTSDTFVGSILAETGMTNIADGADPSAGSYPQLSAEYVLAANPDLLILAHTGGSVPTPEELAARPGWSTLDALDGDAIFIIDTDIASRWGPRVVTLVTDIVDALIDHA